MPENQAPQQMPQGPEGLGMAKEFAENPSMEILRSRRIDQIVSQKEAERAAIAQGMKSAEERGLQNGQAQGYEVGAQEGFNAGHNTGLEAGFGQGYNIGGRDAALGLGQGLPQQQSQEPEIDLTKS